MKKSIRWQKATNLRNYIEAIKINALKNNSISEELQNWIIWANKKADWYDPQIEDEDKLLTDVDKDALTLNKKSWLDYA